MRIMVRRNRRDRYVGDGDAEGVKWHRPPRFKFARLPVRQILVWFGPVFVLVQRGRRNPDGSPRRSRRSAS